MGEDLLGSDLEDAALDDGGGSGALAHDDVVAAHATAARVPAGHGSLAVALLAALAAKHRASLGPFKSLRSRQRQVKFACLSGGGTQAA